MSDKRMLIVPAQLAKKVDDNRGDLSQADFIDFLIESHLEQDIREQSHITKEYLKRYVTKEDLKGFEQGIKGLLRSFLDFFISYGLELGKQPEDDKFEELDRKLQGLGATLSAREQRGDSEE